MAHIKQDIETHIFSFTVSYIGFGHLSYMCSKSYLSVSSCWEARRSSFTGQPNQGHFLFYHQSYHQTGNQTGHQTGHLTGHQTGHPSGHLTGHPTGHQNRTPDTRTGHQNRTPDTKTGHQTGHWKQGLSQSETSRSHTDQSRVISSKLRLNTIYKQLHLQPDLSL